MKQKHNLLTILILALASTLLIFIACEKDDDDEPMNSPPTCTIISPEDGAEFTQGDTITIAVDAVDEDENIQEIKFYVNAMEIGSDISFPYSFDWDTSEEEPGSFAIKVEVVDDEQAEVFDVVDIKLIVQDGAGEPLSDIDGNSYQTVWIDGQNWMAENLRTTTYNDGASIELVESDIGWESFSTDAYCWYDNDEAQYAKIYGALYNWYAVNTGNLCPDGWHVPTDEEWTALEDYIAFDGHNGSEGTALKATFGWNDNDNGTDDYGFKALPGGARNKTGPFYDFGYNGYWWSATDTNAYDAIKRGLLLYDSEVYKTDCSQRDGVSVRCLAD